MNESAPVQDIGIIGVGEMGLAVSRRLLESGRRVIGFRRGSLDEFAALGGTPAKTAADVVAQSTTVLLILPSDMALNSVMAQIGPVLRSGQVVICLSTHPIEIKECAAMVARKAGATMIDGEISGTPAMLMTGQASIILAGNKDVLDAVRPIFAHVTDAVSCLPRFGDAYRTKLIINCLVGVNTLAAAEALYMGISIGLEPEQLYQTLSESAASSQMLTIRGPMMLSHNIGKSDLSGFIGFYEKLTSSLKTVGAASGPLTSLAEGAIRDACTAGFEDRDIAIIYTLLADRLNPDTSGKP